MVEVYVRLIISKKRTFDSVPDRLKNAVKERLYELGYDENGDPIVVENNGEEDAAGIDS